MSSEQLDIEQRGNDRAQIEQSKVGQINERYQGRFCGHWNRRMAKNIQRLPYNRISKTNEWFCRQAGFRNFNYAYINAGMGLKGFRRYK